MAENQNLMSATRPYIHSNYYNFKRYHRNNAGFSKEGTNIKLEERLSKLEKMSRQLEGAAIEFLGGKKGVQKFTIDKFVKLYKGNNKSKEGSFALMFRDFIQERGYFNLILNEINTERMTRLTKEFPKLSKRIRQAMQDNMLSDTEIIIEALDKAGFFPNKNKPIKIDKKTQDNFLREKLKLNEEGLNKFKRVLISKNSTILKKIVNTEIDRISKEYSSKGKKSTNRNTTYYDMILKYVGKDGVEFEKYCKKRGLELSNKTFKKYYLSLLNRISILDSKKVGIGITGIGGTRGEEIMSAIINIDSGGINAQVTGNLSQEDAENKTREKINKFNQKIGNIQIEDNTFDNNRIEGLRGMGKQARYDIIIQNKQNGAITGVQSKNYNDMYSELFKNNQYKTQSIDIFKSNKDTENIIGFIEQLGAITNQTINEESLAYSLANITWFSVAGSFGSQDKEPQEIEDPDQSILIQELGVAILDFLGVAYTTNFDVLPQISNSFWLLNNQYLVPTYVILDELIKIARVQSTKINKERKNLEHIISISLKSSGRGISKKRAIDLRKAKANAVGTFKPENYSDENLVKVGQDMGENVLNGSGEYAVYKTKEILLKFDLQNKFMSAFNF